MDRTQDIVFGAAGQRLVWDAPEGRPSSVSSVKVFAATTGDDGAEEDAISGSAAIDAVSTTLAQASGDGQANPRIVNLDSTAGIEPGRQYLLTSAARAREWIEVLEVAGALVKARSPLANAFAAADTFVGTRLSVGLSSSWTADAGKITGGRGQNPGYRVRWAYDVAATRFTHDSYFDLVRYAGGHTLTAIDVDREYPGLQQMGPGLHRGDGHRALLAQAYERFRWDLAADSLAANAVRSQDAVNRATLLALGVVVARSRVMQGADLRLLELAERDYGDFMARIFQVGMKVPVEDGAGAGVPVLPAPFWVK